MPNLNVIERLSTLEGRREMLPRYFRMHRAAERLARPWLADVPTLDLDGRERLGLVAADLDALELEHPAEDEPPAPLASRAEAMGVLYVLEGSTLGGRMIKKAVHARGCDLTGLSFLDPYGRDTGARWREFVTVLEREAGDDVPGARRGAILGFTHAEACLIG